jgi:hypothetical protein
MWRMGEAKYMWGEGGREGGGWGGADTKKGKGHHARPFPLVMRGTLGHRVPCIIYGIRHFLIA